MSKRGNPNRFIGVYPHEDGWQIRFCKNGVLGTEYRVDRQQADVRAEYLKKMLEGDRLGQEPLSSGPDEQHTVDYWEGVLRRAAEYVLDNSGSEQSIAMAMAISKLAREGLSAAKWRPPPPSDDSSPQESTDVKSLTSEELEKYAKRAGGE